MMFNHDAACTDTNADPFLNKRLHNTAWTKRFALFVLLAAVTLFFALSVPMLSSYSRYRGDEGFYTYASIRMLATGDYITPYYPWGEVRFNKPIFNYWVVAFFYHVFGISLFAARFGQLLAGVATLPVVYYLALAMKSSRQAAILAVVIMAANIQLINISVRATTDVVQLFFISISLLGAARLLFCRSQSSMDYVLLGFGAGLAILTKGAMAGIFLAYVFFYALLMRKQTGVKIRHVINLRVIAMALLPFAVWMGAAVYRNGAMPITGMFSDQVGDRLDEPTNPLMNLALYCGFAVIELLPFTAFIPLMVWHQYDRFKRFLISKRLIVTFACGWAALNIVILMFGDMPRTRYMVLFYPVLAVLIAQVLVYLSRRIQTRLPMLKIMQVLILAAGIFGLAEIAFGMRVSFIIVFCGAMVAATAVTAYLLCRSRGFAWHIIALSAVIFATARYQDLFVRAVLYPSPIVSIAQILESMPYPPQHMAGIQTVDFTRQISLATQGKIEITNIVMNAARANNDDKSDDEFRDNFFYADVRRVLQEKSFDVYMLPINQLPAEIPDDLKESARVAHYRNWRAGDFIAVTFGRRSAQQVFDQRRQEYVLLTRIR